MVRVDGAHQVVRCLVPLLVRVVVVVERLDAVMII